MRSALNNHLQAWILGVIVAVAGGPLAWAADSPVPAAESPVRLAQDIPTQPKMMTPDLKVLAVAVVPDLRGRTEAQARDLLAKAGLKLGKVGQVAYQQTPGTVVRQSPAPKQTAARGSAVNIWLAQAPPIKVPNLIGRPLKEAEAMLVKSGLKLGQVSSVSSSYPEGTVARQSPAANATADKGGAVNVWVAAAQPVKVPDVRKRHVKDAELILRKSGLRLGKVTPRPSDAPEGTVLSQSPSPGQSVKKDSPVNVWIAEVPRPKVPDVRKRSVKDAELILAKSGLRLGEVTPRPSDAPEGTVLSQSPSPGQIVDKDTPVNVWIAEVPRPKVPDVRKRPVKEAELILAKSGLRLGELTPRPSDAPEGTVLSQSPSPGQIVDKDTPVNVWVAEAARLKVPDVVGRPLKEAEAILAEVGLKMREAGREQSEIPAGAVARQSPAPDDVITKGSEVRVWVAQPLLVSVPDLVGLPVEEADRRLRESRLEPGAKSEQPSLPPAGQVIAQKPPAGAEVKVGTRVGVVLGDGSRAQVPGIVGDIEGTALERLAVAGLRPGERRAEESEQPAGEVLRPGERRAEESEQPAGEVLRQRPAEGSVVARGSAVAYWVAEAPKVAVPGIVGLMAGDALGQLEPLGLEGAEMGAEESDRPEGEILRQEPESGARVPRGSRVGFWVASPMPVTVPDLTGMQGPEAEERLRAAGLVAGSSESEESREPEGTVIRQQPPPGERVPRGAPVDYWVASPALVPVPGLSGLSADDARARLVGLGLAMVTRAPEESDAPEGTVIGHEPPEGTPVPLGAEIAVRISAGRPFVVRPWVIGGGIGAALLAAGGGLWLARRPPRPPRAPERPPPAPAKPQVRVRMAEPDAAVDDGLTLDPKAPSVGVRTRLVPGDSEVAAEKELVVREERRET